MTRLLLSLAVLLAACGGATGPVGPAQFTVLVDNTVALQPGVYGPTVYMNWEWGAQCSTTNCLAIVGYAVDTVLGGKKACTHFTATGVPAQDTLVMLVSSAVGVASTPPPPQLVGSWPRYWTVTMSYVTSVSGTEEEATIVADNAAPC